MKIYSKIKHFFSINWIKTIYFNFKVLPFNIAIKLPIVFYGKVKFIDLSGKIQWNVEPKRFICTFGNSQEVFKINNGGELKLSGLLVINGSFSFGNDYSIHLSKNSKLILGGNSYFGKKTLIVCSNSIEIGKSMRLGYESQIIDTNFHYTIDLENGSSKRISYPVILGNYIWIGNRATIMSGTETNDFLIVASNSLLNKNYKSIIPKYSLIGGIPAKLLKENVVRVFDPQMERKIGKLFLDQTIESLNVYEVLELNAESFTEKMWDKKNTINLKSLF